MQRHALLMFTSCGWFFDEVSRPEGTQILRYAARAIELAGDVAGVQLEKAFVKRLALIPSNVDLFRNGAEVYRQLVKSAQISLEQVAAHYAISSLFTPYAPEQRIYCYTAQQSDYQLRRMGALTLAIAQLQLTSDITRESVNFTVAVLHLGGWDFHCCIQPFTGRRAYSQIRDALFDALRQASAAQTILAMHRCFGDQSFSLQDLFAEERHRIMQLLSQETLTRLDQLYTQVYRDNYGVLMAFHRDDVEAPKELQVAAEIALGHRALIAVQAIDRETSDFPFTKPQLCQSYLAELQAIATEADQLRCSLQLPELRQTLERIVLRSLHHCLSDFAIVRWLEQLLETSSQLHQPLALDRAQEVYLQALPDRVLPAIESGQIEARSLLRLGDRLAIDVRDWLTES